MGSTFSDCRISSGERSSRPAKIQQRQQNLLEEDEDFDDALQQTVAILDYFTMVKRRDETCFS